jgi:hypothetical protein
MITTTVKQVETLLAAGIDPSTADMSFIKNPKGGTILTATKPMVKDDIPCWSMAGLWKICRDRNILVEFFTDEDEESVISNLIMAICEDIEEKKQNS